ncbi:hypothetical protein TNCV_1856461 [Trichonephila clavipes]|nr:hypothetical protein TNCV_1856461 [Trichonephila clavipes]
MACAGADAASTRCHSSSTVVTAVWRRASRSATMGQTFERSGKRAGKGDNRTFSVSRKVRTIQHPHTSRQVMGQYDENECMLPMCVHHDAAKNGCDHLDAVNRTWIHLKKMTSRHSCTQVHC